MRLPFHKRRIKRRVTAERRPDNFFDLAIRIRPAATCRGRFTVGTRPRLTGADPDATPDALCFQYIPNRRKVKRVWKNKLKFVFRNARGEKQPENEIGGSPGDADGGRAFPRELGEVFEAVVRQLFVTAVEDVDE